MTHQLAQILVVTIIAAAYLIHRALRQITTALQSTSVSTFQIGQAVSMSAPAHPPSDWGIVEEGDQIAITLPGTPQTQTLYQVTKVHENNSITVGPWPTTPTEEA